MPDPAAASDTEWADYVFNRSGAPGVKREWWCHVPSGIWFIAERNTLDDQVIRTHLWGDAAG
jgi:sarcosine oxidase subunit delta